MSCSFEIIQDAVECQQVIKKSRFITHLLPVADKYQAMSEIEQIRQEYPDARHHCWAFIAGAPDDTQVLGFSDDGEPNGTAGKPILAQLRGSGLGYICAVVVRYFGGVKLGTGGLVRAYGSSVGQALDLVIRHPFVEKVTMTLHFGFELLGTVTQLLRQYHAQQFDTTYTTQVGLTVVLAKCDKDDFCEHIMNACSGKIEFDR
ncbi:MAG: IMPACT family member YigZ [Candidatus Celerinatantimonas neptuna]|nr:MAG: IMPACT family member YigZ [Candidatus Celerinatantimonas neptuna]